MKNLSTIFGILSFLVYFYLMYKGLDFAALRWLSTLHSRPRAVSDVITIEGLCKQRNIWSYSTEEECLIAFKTAIQP